MANRKYDPIRETFQTDDIVAIDPLSTAVTPPGDLSITAAYATAQPAWPRLFPASGQISAGRLVGFQINDVPRLLGMGLFCNLGDCLVDISNHNNVCQGAYVNVNLNQYTLADAFVATIATDTYRFNTLNAIFDYDVSYLPNLQHYFALAPYAVNATQYLRFDISFGADSNFTDALYSTILMDPAFKDKRLSMWANLVIEHSFPVFHAVTASEECPS